MRFTIVVAAIVLTIPLSVMPPEESARAAATEHPSADSLQRKLDHIEKNATLSRPDPGPTTIGEDEINDYLVAGRIRLPDGVENATFHAQSGVITALATIDFDEIRSRQNYNPLLLLFKGTHAVRLEAEGAASGGEARIHLRAVSMDGVDIPPQAIGALLDAYVTPKYPNVGVDTSFHLADRIDAVIVGDQKITVIQK